MEEKRRNNSLEDLKNQFDGLNEFEKFKKLEIVYSAFNIVTKDVLNDYGLVMFGVLNTIFRDEKTPTIEDERKSIKVMEEKNISEIKVNLKIYGYEEVKEKVQYLKHITEELEKTLNFLKDYNFNLEIAKSCAADVKDSYQEV